MQNGQVDEADALLDHVIRMLVLDKANNAVNKPRRGQPPTKFAENKFAEKICTVNSDAKVLAWALSFDDDESILKFLDHVKTRYEQSPDSQESVVAERFRTFPSRQLANVEDNGKRIAVPQQHAADERCPATPAFQAGTLVGRIIGRPLDQHGHPISATVRQEDYMEARFEVSVTDQEDLATAARGAGGKRFQIPDEFAQSLVTPAFLGQLDVNPMGTVPGSQNDSQRREFWGQTIESEGSELVRIRIDGESHIAGGHNGGGGGRQPRNDGRMFEHLVTLKWQGYADLSDNRVTQLVMIANGNERLRAGNPRADFLGAPAASHLMAGHPIDLDCAVRYGLSAEPCSSEEIVEGAGKALRGSKLPD